MTGFYGKVPYLGDFVSRRLPAELVEPWDQWLQESLVATRGQLGAQWLDVYLTSPLWRFVLSPGVAGQGAWAGVLMPSVDRVGRYFPLTLACPLPAGSNPCAVIQTSAWFEQAEALALSTLQDPFSLEAFDAEVLALAPPTSGGVAHGQGGRCDAWYLGLPDEGLGPSVCTRLLAEALDQVFLAYSLWSTLGSEQVGPSLLACQGLPPVDGFTALLDGDWAGRGWRLLARQPPPV